MFTENSSKELEDALRKIGVSKNGTHTLIILLEKGELRANKIAYFSGIRRELVYRALDELIEEGLVSKIEKPSQVATFRASHPEMIVEKLKKSGSEIKSSINILSDHMSTLVGIYNKNIGLPNVVFREGLSGLEYLYNDILDVGQNIKLVRSPLDINHPETKELISHQRELQNKQGIQVKLVTSFSYPSLEEARILDRQYGIERKIIPNELLNTPAQIIIYGDKVGITSFDASFVTTIIDNKAIRQTFDTLFAILWSVGK